MSGFYVGQRVRFVKARTPAGVPYVGTEAVVLELDLGAGTISCNGKLNLVPADLLVRYRDGADGAVMAWQVVPIIPEGMEPIEDVLALWLPEDALA